MLSRASARLRTQGTRQMTRRSYSGQAYDQNSAGATSASGSFGKKEKAAENQWARAHDAEKLKLLKEMLAEHKKSAEDLEKKLAEMSNKAK
ncbi:hypothetical protein DM01DRAFT_1061088 [Hesseltinella vesiculosa]|uniref:ATPase inhibitor, mitochondrial n=1 Tax=Hesseltinella vesiculosa TaxID=101127 RepID=A0A1X2GF61_9FUNG|nr:hypothetical protein DM01DRAFT_1061088 [Hesseltinella vesiculosa]